MRQDKKDQVLREGGLVNCYRKHSKHLLDSDEWAKSIVLKMTADFMQEVICAGDLLSVYRASDSGAAVVEAAELLRKGGEEGLALRLLESYVRTDTLSAFGPLANRVGTWRNGTNEYPVFRAWFCYHAINMWREKSNYTETEIIMRLNKEANDRNNEMWKAKESGAEINQLDAVFYEETKGGGPEPRTMEGWLYEIEPIAKHPVSRI